MVTVAGKEKSRFELGLYPQTSLRGPTRSFTFGKVSSSDDSIESKGLASRGTRKNKYKSGEQVSRNSGDRSAKLTVMWTQH